MKQFIILTLLLLICTGIQAQRYQTGAKSLVFTDSLRNNRIVHAQIFYPADSLGELAKGQFPMVIFAHGEGISFTEYDYVWLSLIGNGYILAFPTTEQGPTYSVTSMQGDLLSIWDRMTQKGNPTNTYFEKSMSGYLGLMGHGLGGSAAILAAAKNQEGLRSLITFSAIESQPSAIAAAADIQVPYLSIGTDSECLATYEDHQLPILEACGSSYKASVQIKRGTFCQFGRSFDGTPCRDKEIATCPLMPPTVSRTQQHTISLLGLFPWMEFLLRAQCSNWEYFHSFARNPSTHTFKEWGIQPSPEAVFTLKQTGSAIWLTNQSRSHGPISWEFGDGKSSSDINPAHLYHMVDTYQVKLTVQALNGCLDSAFQEIKDLKAVELLGFRAKSEDNTIVLDWATATESENAFFVIERSINGIDFHDYAKVPGEMSSLSRKNYVFEDPSLPSGIYFYRLRQETTYDSITHSELVQVKHQLSISLAITDFSISIPESRLKVGFHCEKEGPTTLRLLSPLGAMLFSEEVIAIPGRNEKTFSIPRFQPGVYFLTATQRGETANRTIFIR